LGQIVNSFFRIKCKLGELGEDKKHFTGADKRHITMFATLDGGLGYIMPVPEKTYRRLLMLQNVLVSQGAHIAGLNPKAFQTYKSWKKLQTNPARSVIDGELVYNYLHLSIPEKLEVSKKIGTKLEELLDDLSDIQKITNHF
jgi:cleavage and polyadenylation specificity factor subunit 1